MDIKNLSIIRQSFASTVFTHKVQEIASENQEKNVFIIKIINIIIVSIVLILLIIQASNPENLIFSFIGAGITVAEIIFLIIQLSFNFEQKVIMHKNSALKYMGLRDAYRSLITDVMNEIIQTNEIVGRRDLLQREYQIISDLAPQTSNKEYSEAQKRLNKRGAVSGEEFTWSDEEIDWFLPESLRLKKLS
ncbi:MAG: SLATT domain-containing protein [bacterium]|nr:SLATT domain-containing protein [bacterium]